jgi:hypothetical protein
MKFYVPITNLYGFIIFTYAFRVIFIVLSRILQNVRSTWSQTYVVFERFRFQILDRKWATLKPEISDDDVRCFNNIWNVVHSPSFSNVTEVSYSFTPLLLPFISFLIHRSLIITSFETL